MIIHEYQIPQAPASTPYPEPFTLMGGHDFTYAEVRQFKIRIGDPSFFVPF